LVRRLFDAFRRAPLHDLARRTFGDDYVFLLNACALRHHKSEVSTSALTMHFDGMFLGGDHPSVNFWIPLADVGETVPGISFIANKELEALIWQHFNAGQERRGWQPADPSILYRLMPPNVREKLASMTYTPKARAGDAIAFDGATLHATQEMAAWTGHRVSLEFRVAARNAIPVIYRTRKKNIAWFNGDLDNYTVVFDRHEDPC
jgi:hypothetical protein